MSSQVSGVSKPIKPTPYYARVVWFLLSLAGLALLTFALFDWLLPSVFQNVEMWIDAS